MKLIRYRSHRSHNPPPYALHSTALDLIVSAMDLALPPPDSTAPSEGQTELKAPEFGAGLSDAQLSQSRRQTLDLVNRLHSTGFVNVPRLLFPSYTTANVAIRQQSSSRHRSAPDRCRRATELRKIVSDRVRIWDHFASCRRYLYEVRCDFNLSFHVIWLKMLVQMPNRMSLEGQHWTLAM